MSPLDDLYQELLLEHKRQPRNWGRLPHANRHADGHNPLCGDTIALDVMIQGEVVSEIAFEGAGCAICIASASLMTQAVKGTAVTDATHLVEAMYQMLTNEGSSHDPDDNYLGKLVVLRGVRRFPSRIKCAALAWHALAQCLREKDNARRDGTQTEEHPDAVGTA